jgi:hypothetical protein
VPSGTAFNTTGTTAIRVRVSIRNMTAPRVSSSATREFQKAPLPFVISEIHYHYPVRGLRETNPTVSAPPLLWVIAVSCSELSC